MEKSHIKTQFLRLKRHYDFSKTSTDQVGLLDLSHTLRIWTEMTKEVDKLISEEAPQTIFENVEKNKDVKRIMNNSDFVYLPLASGPNIEGTEIRGTAVINRALTEEEIKKIFAAGPPKEVKTNLSFSEWLNSGIFETNDEDGKKISISRLHIIKRVANTLGASHPMGKENADEFDNKFNKPIHKLTEIVILGYPATHYQLLEIAEQIIEKLNALFKD